MKNFKREFLAQLESKFQHTKFATAGEHLQGASPPSVFIGRFGYPKVFVGPLIPNQSGDTLFMDSPEQWISQGKTASEIVDFRMGLVRGKQAVSIWDESRKAEQMREIALSQVSPEVDATFTHKPRGSFFNDDALAFGPSALLKKLEVNSGKWDQKLEVMFHDTDCRTTTAVQELYEKGSTVSAITRAFSVGAFGLEKNRKFVPTRWSITAVDSNLSENLLEEVKILPLLDRPLVFKHSSLSQTYAVILFPSQWQYDWVEAFFSNGRDATTFGDGEGFDRKKEYSSVGGCYYSTRLALCEKMNKLGKQAGAIVLRECYSDYVPLGVWNVRENVRHALAQPPVEFNEYTAAVKHAFAALKLEPKHWVRNSKILREGPKAQPLQKTLACFNA